MRQLRRAARFVGTVVGAWLGIFVVVNVLILLVGFLARLGGKDPQLRDDDWPGVTHLRMVDDHLLVGGQTTTEEYAELAEHGVTMVVDLRSNDLGGDSDRDDPDAIRELGMEYVAMPIPDGRAPTPDQTRRFLELVDSHDGVVFAHCGGGVGRSTSVAAVYESSRGQDPSVLEQLAVGPPTLEQIFFVGTLRPNHPEHSISPAVAIVSRAVDFPRTVYGWVLDQF